MSHSCIVMVVDFIDGRTQRLEEPHESKLHLNHLNDVFSIINVEHLPRKTIFMMIFNESDANRFSQLKLTYHPLANRQVESEALLQLLRSLSWKRNSPNTTNTCQKHSGNTSLLL